MMRSSYFTTTYSFSSPSTNVRELAIILWPSHGLIGFPNNLRSEWLPVIWFIGYVIDDEKSLFFSGTFFFLFFLFPCHSSSCSLKRTVQSRIHLEERRRRHHTTNSRMNKTLWNSLGVVKIKRKSRQNENICVLYILFKPKMTQVDFS